MKRHTNKQGRQRRTITNMSKHRHLQISNMDLINNNRCAGRVTVVCNIHVNPVISLEMPVPSQGHYRFHSFPVVD